jgi:hypothetical protein
MIFNCDGGSDPFVVALNKRTGEVIWRVERRSEAKNKFSFSTPLVITVAGRPQVVTAGSGVVSALDPKDGVELWRVYYGQGYSVVPRPVFGHGLIFISTGFDRPSVLAIRPDGQGDVSDTHVAWSLSKGAPNTPSLLLVGDELYMISDGGIASCVTDGVDAAVVAKLPDDEGPPTPAVVDEFAARLDALVSDAALRARIGAAGKACVERLVRTNDFAGDTRRAIERAHADRGAPDAS